MSRKLRALAASAILAASALLAFSTGADAQTVTPISQLPNASAPLTGTEYVPCVQGGVTKKCLASAVAGTGSLSYTPANAATFVAASDYGVSTSSNDNSAAFNAIDAAGKVAVLAPGVYKVANTISFTHSATGIICLSGGYAGQYSTALWNATSLKSGCWLQWTGNSGGTMMVLSPPLTTSGTRMLGNRVEGLQFDGNNGLAANGLLTYSLYYGVFDRLFFQNLSGGTAFSLDVLQATNSNFGDVCTSQFNRVSNLTTVTNGPIQYNYRAIYLGTWFASNLPISNSAGACNASLNYLFNIDVGHSTSDAIDINGGDNNVFDNVRTYHYGGATTYSVRFQAYHNAAGAYPANSNVIRHLSANAPAYAEGQGSFPGCLAWFNGGATCTFGNELVDLDHSNASPEPIIEGGAMMFWSENSGAKGGAQMMSPQSIADTQTGQANGVKNIGTYSLYLTNTTNTYFAADNGAGCVWAMVGDGAGNAKFANNGGCSNGALGAPFFLTFSYTFSQLTALTGVQIGTRAYVTNTSVCTFNTAVNGSGAIGCPVIYNGSGWVAG